MNYSNIYKLFIHNRKAKSSLLVGYSETHHIIPRSLGGKNIKENLIKLSASDHFFAHLLLAKIHGGKMWQALSFMAQDKTVSAKGIGAKRRWFEKARKEAANQAAIDLKGRVFSEDTRKKISEAASGKNNPMFGVSGELSPRYGKLHTIETKERIAKSLTGKKLSEETRRKMSASRVGKSPSKEKREKLSISKLGKNNPSYGRVVSTETREKLSSAGIKRYSNKTSTGLVAL